MRSTRCLSSDRCSYLWSSIRPSRPELTAITLSRRTQRHSYADAPDRASKCLGLLSPIAGILAAVLLFTSPLAGRFCLASTSSAQNLSRAESTDRLANFIDEASDRFAVPARWIRAVIQVESGGDEHAISPRGAMGLMQLMLGTWVELGVRYGLGLDPFDPRDNVFAGAVYLRESTTASDRPTSLRPTTRVRRGMSITSQQGNRFHQTPWPSRCSRSTDRRRTRRAHRIWRQACRSLAAVSAVYRPRRRTRLTIGVHPSCCNTQFIGQFTTGFPRQNGPSRAVSPSIKQGSTAMTALHFLANGCESLGGSGLEDGRWKRATEEGRIKAARCGRSV